MNLVFYLLGILEFFFMNYGMVLLNLVVSGFLDDVVAGNSSFLNNDSSRKQFLIMSRLLSK